VKWALVTTAISTFFLQQDGFLSSLSSVGVPYAYLSPVVHIVSVVSAAGIVTEVAKYAVPKLPRAFTKKLGRKPSRKTEKASNPSTTTSLAPTRATQEDSSSDIAPPAPDGSLSASETTEKNANVHVAPRKGAHGSFVQVVASATEGGKN
jgi:hypothetical protein